jgi:hypothetical protein
MKQVIIYNQLNTTNHGARRWNDSGLSNYLKAQIDNSIRLGWDVNDIILGTNFNFEYNGVKSHHLTNICEWSGFHNFWYGALELVNRGIVNEEFWLHDHDSWQIAPMEFPKFNGTVAGIEYGATPEWNCGSIYFNRNSSDILEYIVDTLECNKDVNVSSDEVIIGFIRRHSPYRDQFISINSRWNVGMTHANLRLGNAIKPAIVLSFKPDEENIYDRLTDKGLINLVDPDFLHILNKHFKNAIN